MSDKEIKEQKENNEIENIEMENMGKWSKFKNIVLKIICSIAVIVILLSIYEPIIFKTHEGAEIVYTLSTPDVLTIENNDLKFKPNPITFEDFDKNPRILSRINSIYYAIPTIIILILYTKLMFKVKIYKTKKDIWYSVFIYIIIIETCVSTMASTYTVIS